jgi:hypothetical protein
VNIQTGLRIFALCFGLTIKEAEVKKRIARKILRNHRLNHKESSVDNAFAVLYGHDSKGFRSRAKMYMEAIDSMVQQTNEELGA